MRAGEKTEGRLGEGERKGKPLDVEATRQPEYGWKTGKDARKRKDGQPSDRRRAREQRDNTVSSRRDKLPVNNPYEDGWGCRTEGWRGQLHNPASFSFSSDEGRRMKYSTLIRCNCDVVLENSPGPLPFPSSQLSVAVVIATTSVGLSCTVLFHL